MIIEVKAAALQDKPAITHLMQLYMHDFSALIGLDAGADGLYPPYPGIDAWWQAAPAYFPFLIKAGGNLAGFALVRQEAAASYSVTEFFILKKYRRSGVGKTTACRLFDQYRGEWVIRQRPTNEAARAFWRSVAGAYSSGQYTETMEEERWVQRFDNRVR